MYFNEIYKDTIINNYTTLLGDSILIKDQTSTRILKITKVNKNTYQFSNDTTLIQEVKSENAVNILENNKISSINFANNTVISPYKTIIYIPKNDTCIGIHSDLYSNDIDTIIYTIKNDTLLSFYNHNKTFRMTKDVLNTIRKFSPQLARIHRAYTKFGVSDGKILLDVLVSSSGRIIESKVASSNTENAAFDERIREEAANIFDFGLAPFSGVVNFKIPLIFGK